MKKTRSRMAEDFIRDNIFRDKKEVANEAAKRFRLSLGTVITIINCIQKEIKEELEDVKKEIIENLSNEKVNKSNKFIFDDSALWR